MAYRDENQHLRARVEELEDELATAKQRIQTLEAPDAGGEKSLGERLAGAKLRIVHEQVLDGELPADSHEELVEVLRRRYNVLGQASSVGKSLGWSNAMPQGTRAVEVSVSARNGKTTVRGVERLGNLAGGLFGGIVGGVGGGGMALVVPLVLALRFPGALPVAIVLWIALVYAVVRAAFARLVQGRDRELRAALDEVTSVARENIARERQKKLRVDADEPAEEEEEADEAPEPRRARRKTGD